MNFAVPILGTCCFERFTVGNIGSICMAIVNIVNSFSNFLVPSVIKMFGSAERTIFWCSFSYMFSSFFLVIFRVYIVQFSYILPVVPYLICACHGFLSAVLLANFLFNFRWSGPAKVLSSGTIPMTLTGARSLVFSCLFICLAVYCFSALSHSQALGSITSGVLVDKLGISSDIHNGWNGSTSFLFIFLGCVAGFSVIPIAFIKKCVFSIPCEMVVVPSGSSTPESSGNNTLNNNEQTFKEELQSGKKASSSSSSSSQPRSILSEVRSVLHTAITPRMLLLLCFFFNDGYQQVFLQNMFTRQIVNLATVGTMTGVYCIADMIFAFIHGWVSDRFGHIVVVSVAVFSELVAVVLSWFANSLQNWLIFATGVVMAIADSGFQTEVAARKRVDRSVWPR